jgi:multicomponent K+:H+ antiporter subunit A
MSPVLIPLAPLALFAAAPICAAISVRSRIASTMAAAGALLLALALLAPLMPSVVSGEPIIQRHDWAQELGLSLSFRLDGLGLLFALLILGVGALICAYAAYYLPEDDKLGRFHALLLVFAGAMLGVVLSENILLMLMFWEVTSIASFLLIAYKHGAHDARIAARMALAITGGGGLALLAGLLLLGAAAGSFELSDILARGDQIRAHAHYPLILVFVLLGAFTKSAQVPFQFWLPNAMAAPTPISAYLHSATMVKAGVFLLARLHPALAQTELWFALVAATGAVTFAFGAFLALVKHDFKGLLAYSTVSHLGLITLMFGLDTPTSVAAGLFHIINHAVFKAALFMAAGVIDHECGTRDMRRINGLFKYMPWTAALAIVSAGGMAGVPLLNGFISKEMFFAETVGHPALGGYAAVVVPALATLAGAMSVAYSIRFVHDVFFNGEPVDLPRTPKEPVRWMRAPIEVLVAFVLILGLAPQFAVGALLDAAAGAVLGADAPVLKLALWHGFNLPLAMSGAALAGGAAYYVLREHVFRLHDRLAPPFTSPVAFERVYRDVARASAWLIAKCDNGAAGRYLLAFLLFCVGLGAWAWLSAAHVSLQGSLGAGAWSIDLIGGAAAAAIGAIGAVVTRDRPFIALIFTSLVGLVAALAFVRLAAPDLALTQLSVEVVTIILLLLALRFLPSEAAGERAPQRLLAHGVVAVLSGAGVAALAFAMLTRPFSTISGFHIENALPGGGGANVVNVILVDFRGFDTYGEIVVLVIAAIGALALLDDLRLTPYQAPARRESDRHPILLAMLMRPLLPLALTVAAYMFLRGHSLPGGGFIAGLVAAIAITLQYMAAGLDFANARLKLDYVRLAALGVIVATATGLAAWAFGQPFLKSAFRYVEAPIIGKFEIASAMAFDLGVFLVVVGVTLAVLSEIGELGRRESELERARWP